MRAAVMRNWSLAIEEVPDPVPGAGQVLAKVLACGICGSDLHLLAHGPAQMELSAEMAASRPPDPMAPLPFDPACTTIMGHEFCAEVVELGPECSNLQVGDRVVSLPIAFDERGIHALGFSSILPGGYAELMVLNDLMGIKVPNGLDHRLAALTEPLAVGEHAVNKAGVTPRDSAVVLGCGPVGLAVIAALARRGVEPIVASDFSPRRRALATHLGAHVVVDTASELPMDAWRATGTGKPLVMFEAVGVPGMLDMAMRVAPRNSRICVVGVCMQPDQIRPMLGISGELTVQFVLAYDPMEFAESLRVIAEGEVDLSPLITGTVDVDGVPQAFTDLGNPEAHAKILVEPARWSS